MNARTFRCALLGSFTLDQLPTLVTERLRADGINCEWHIAPFNQYPQQILSEDSELVAFAPQVVFLAVAIEDLLAHLPSPWSQPSERLEAGRQRVAEFLALVRHLAERLPAATIFVHDLWPLESQLHAVLAAKSPASVRELASYANRHLAELTRQFNNLFALHLDDAFAGQPRVELFDRRFFYLAKMRLSRSALESLAGHYRSLVLARLGLRKKCLVLDLDNTLWGGIVGEDGAENLLLADDGPGRAFQDFQRVLCQYYETGTLLAICSRNDEELALSVIREHPGMVLRPRHFAAMRINWQDKATNLRSLAGELNLGLDAFVFLDDSAFEREQVRRVVPEIVVPDLPSDPSDYADFAVRLPYFQTLAVTEEDRKRGQMYVEDRQRRELQYTAATLEEFLKGLEIQVTVKRADRFLLPRLAQLTQRTNQFNLTTRRYTENDLAALAQQNDWKLYVVSARDRIGDSGIVGAALVQLDHSAVRARLDTFLLSCRILGRGIESAFLAGLLTDLGAVGVTFLRAEFIPTKRNSLAKDFLSRHGFTPDGDFWQRPLTGANALCPAWITLDMNER